MVSVQWTWISLGNISARVLDAVHVTIPVSPKSLALDATAFLESPCPLLQEAPGYVAVRQLTNGRYIFFRYGGRIRAKSRFAKSGI